MQEEDNTIPHATRATVAQAAQSLGVSHMRVYQLITAKILPAEKIDGYLKVRYDDVEAYRVQRDRWLILHGRKLPAQT